MSERRGALALPPNDRRCKGISKRTGERCSNYAIRDRELCSGHALVGVHARSREAEKRRILGVEHGVPEDVADRENELLSREDQERAELRARLHERMKAELDEHHRLVREQEEARRRAAVNPPRPLTDREVEDGAIWIKDYDSLHTYEGKFRDDVLVDLDGRQFRWVVRKRDRLIRLAQAELVPMTDARKREANDRALILGQPLPYAEMAPRESVAERLNRRNRERAYEVNHRSSCSCPSCEARKIQARRERRRDPQVERVIRAFLRGIEADARATGLIK